MDRLSKSRVSQRYWTGVGMVFTGYRSGIGRGEAREH